MGDKSGIEWCDATWNWVVGCTPVSAGCDHCCAKTLLGRIKELEAELETACAGCKRPRYFVTLDEESIPRAITALAEELELEAFPESRAHFLTAIVYTALDAGYTAKRKADGLKVPVPSEALLEWTRKCEEDEG